jgi:hypothetical protein
MTSPRRQARIAGLFYLLLALFSGGTSIWFDAVILEPGDAAATAGNVVTHAGTLRAVLVAELAGAVSYVLAAMALYRLLRHVDPASAAAMVVFSAIGSALMGAGALCSYAAFAVATDPSWATALGGGTDSLVLAMYDLREHGYLLAQVHFALWLLPMARLVHRSGWFPRGLAALLVIGAAGYLVDLAARIAIPTVGGELSPFAVLPAIVGELWMVGYLLVKGVRSGAAAAPAPAVSTA